MCLSLLVCHSHACTISGGSHWHLARMCHEGERRAHLMKGVFKTSLQHRVHCINFIIAVTAEALHRTLMEAVYQQK